MCVLGSWQMPRKIQVNNFTKELLWPDRGVEQWMYLTLVCGLQWVSAKLTHMHMFCLILDKKKIIIFSGVTHLRPFPQNLKEVNKEAAFLLASLFGCAHLALYPLAPLSSSQPLLLQLLVANNTGKGTCPKVWVTTFGFWGQMVILWHL